jgi:hypothetical protein
MDTLRVFRPRAGSVWSVRENARAASRFLEDHKGLAAAGALTLLVGAEAWRRRQNKMYTEPEEEDGPRAPRALQYNNELAVLLKEKGDAPIDGDQRGVVIVDPAGMHFIKNGPDDAKGASRAIYNFLDITTFPTHVTRKIQKEGDAACCKYEVPGKKGETRHVVHVVGPDFTQITKKEVLWHEAVKRLGTAYANAINEAEELKDVTAVRLPVISGGIFAGKFGYDAPNGGCVPELTARAIWYALAGIRNGKELKHEYWLCMWKGDDIGRFGRALKLASSVAMYTGGVYTGLDQGSPQKNPRAAVPNLVVNKTRYCRGAVGYARFLYQKRKPGTNTKIGLMIAGNNGRPGGSVGKGLESIPIVDNHIVNKGVLRKLDTQEESVVSDWLDAVAGTKHDERSRVFRSTICGMWGQVEADSADTIQGVDYTKSKDANDYNRAWVVRDAHLENGSECTATLVFVAGPNANEDAGETAGGSTKKTFSKEAQNKYVFFKECVSQSVLAGLHAMKKENVTHALVACVSCGLYAGGHKRDIKREFQFRGLVERLVAGMSHTFTEVTIVGIGECLEDRQVRSSRAHRRKARASAV